MTHPTATDFFARLTETVASARATDLAGEPCLLDEAYAGLVARCQAAHAAGRKLMFIGNGGSAAIASHMAIDFSKNAGLRAVSFNDGAALTCLGNDLGYERVFAAQIELHAAPGDVLVAISSSGRSENILQAAASARRLGCFVVTLSGFASSNPLRRLGDLNLYVPSSQYGLVEVAHTAMCHAAVELALASKPERAAA